MIETKIIVYLTPNAGKNQVVFYKDNIFKVCVKAKPINNAANEALINILAKEFSITKSAITIRRGQKTRKKLVNIQGLSEMDIKNHQNL